MTSRSHTIAFVITELEVGGAERCLTKVAHGLQPDRFASLVISLGPRPAAPRDALVRELEQHHIPIHFLGFRRPWQLPLAVRALRQLLRRTRPDLIQSMLYHANVVTRLARERRTAAPWCAGIRVADPARTRQLAERWSLSQAAQVICVSQKVAHYAADRMRVPQERLRVIPNGVDVDALSRATAADLRRFGVADSQRVITCVARLARQKGIDRLLHAAVHFLPKLPRHDLLLVGDGPLDTSLRALAHTLGIAQRVHFCGWQPQVEEILLASDLLVLPSQWEGMPNVLLEAMACGRPVVCTPVEGVREVLGPLAEPQAVPAENPQVFADKILTIITQPALAAQLGSSNRARVQADFSLEAAVHRYAALYCELLQGR